MLTLNIPPQKDPIARISLIACAVLVAYAAFVSDWTAAIEPAQLPDLFDPIGQLQYAVIILSLIVAILSGVFRKRQQHAAPTVPFVRVPLKNAERFAILKRDNYRCQICGMTSAQGVALQVDHKLAVTNGGTNDPANLWTLCARCNNGKSDSYL